MVHCDNVPLPPMIDPRSLTGGLATAEVIQATDRDLVVSFGVQQVAAKLAVLDYDAEPGDQLLILGDEASGYFAIGVLGTARPRPRLKITASKQSGATILSVEDGDLELVAPRGAVRLVSAAGIEATTSGSIELNGRESVRLSILDRANQSPRCLSLTRRSCELRHEQVEISTERLRASARIGEVAAGEATVHVGVLSLVSRRLSADLGSLMTRAQTVYQQVADLWQLAAKRTRIVVEETSHHKAQRIYSKADDVKVKAEKIHLG